jgi:hypothetical protein
MSTQKEEQYVEMILQLKEWFEQKVENLNFILENKNESKILFEGKDGDQVELPEHLKEGFLFGVQMSIEVLGEFPVKISKEG